MKTMLLAAAAALSLGIGSAYADSEGGQIANTQFTSIPGFLAQAPAQNASAVATAQNGRAVQTYADPVEPRHLAVSARMAVRQQRLTQVDR